MRKGLFVSAPLTEPKMDRSLELGVNEISLSWHNLDPVQTAQLREHGIKVFAEISLFVGEELWQKYPDARPVSRDGEPFKPTDWYHGVCPNHPGVREEKLAAVDHIIKAFDIDGIWLDFIRYPCHWEEVRALPIDEFCFCQHCQQKFAAEIGGAMEGERWIQWKCDQNTDFVREVHEHIATSGRTIELGLFAIPWRQTDYNGAVRSIIGQDFAALSRYIDVFGVMAYHKFTDHPVGWIHEVVDEISQLTQSTVMPLVQSLDTPFEVPPREFAAALQAGMLPPSSGVMVFHFEDMLHNQLKTQSLHQAFNCE